ncbi:hypothetical protein NUU61_007013 [Penicillium alfredii]|uniref:Uncharacterized protein n=1 Tax=Penicillium alfredii TaxID=1506179 RepID=A0A9W9K3V2_9EURO|nr:uncharacterized protein NUU61_007013 [Penicillium alfredii]KAJ5092143.1 hypothetical protein NUU61_007013 [Penicillium alfredii]
MYRFFNYCIKLKYGEDGFRGYYRRITRTRITSKDSEEINTRPSYTLNGDQVGVYKEIPRNFIAFESYSLKAVDNR